MNHNMHKPIREAGIYKITNTIDGKCYVGQSVDVKKRLNIHRNTLKANNHGNELLQRAYNKHKEFTFEVIELCDVGDLDNKEVFWIDLFGATDRGHGYNFESGGNALKTHHKDSIEKMRVVTRGTNNLLTEECVRVIKEDLVQGVTAIELAGRYKVHFSTISKIARLTNWTYVSPHLNDKLLSLGGKEAKARRDKEALRIHYEGVRVKALRAESVEATRQDFLNNVAEAITLEREGIGKTEYRRRVYDLREGKELELRNKIQSMHESGVKNKDIAVELGMHRTTVTEYLKGRTGKRRSATVVTDELKKTIANKLRDGLSQREVSRVLEVSRTVIRKVIDEKGIGVL